MEAASVRQGANPKPAFLRDCPIAAADLVSSYFLLKPFPDLMDYAAVPRRSGGPPSVLTGPGFLVTVTEKGGIPDAGLYT